jgi:hypothetical protein
MTTCQNLTFKLLIAGHWLRKVEVLNAIKWRGLAKISIKPVISKAVKT